MFQIKIPALMVTTGKDQILVPELSKGMEDLVRKPASRRSAGYRRTGLEHCLSDLCSQIPDLRRGHIEECGHWTQMERPAETNRILISWLKETCGASPEL